MHYVYISGPIQGDGRTPREVNCRVAILVGSQLVEAGFVPFVPHLNILWNMIQPGPEKAWIEYDLAWIRRCDCLLRLPGESRGADLEVAEAKRIGIPVCYSVDELVEARADNLALLGGGRKGSQSEG